MRTSVSLAASLCLMAISGIVPAQAGTSYGCHNCVPTFMSIVTSSGSHGVPDPTRRGRFVSHFDSVGVPQSIVTPADSGEQLVEVPCEEPKNTWYSWFD
jgi:hypothetical protein